MFRVRLSFCIFACHFQMRITLTLPVASTHEAQRWALSHRAVHSASTPRKSCISWMHESYYLNAAHATGSTNLLTSAGCSVCCVPTWHFSDKGKMQKVTCSALSSCTSPQKTGHKIIGTVPSHYKDIAVFHKKGKILQII